ncbi:MAG: RpiB/LacA/LacB family sugar-phosphate isomerase [Leptospiraceae bacterium]|nr:RpiB/LacA/LacB family sugar-phosphate isomerase [Leptospiraceae bacterium]MDW7976487.1 RpiB/LacA/LacB family sugar-phosphate isomerase [Leptospiraceae bacterium]
MKVAISSDEWAEVVEIVINECKNRGYEVEYYGPDKRESSVDWPIVSAKVACLVAQKKVDFGIVMCWTGTGATLAANKFQGVRAALCFDAETAKGAKIWNHANVLGLSLRLTTPFKAKEILAAFFDTPYSEDEWNKRQMARIAEIEEKQCKFVKDI